MSDYDQKYWDDRIPNYVPDRVRRAIKRIYASYPPNSLPQGQADPMYIMNVIALELGIGDGKGNFYDLPSSHQHVKTEEQRLYHRGIDGYPVGADNKMKLNWGKIPTSNMFWDGYKYVQAAAIHGWMWSNDQRRWMALVTLGDGKTKMWTYPEYTD